MIDRPFGKTGLEVSPVGLGTSQIGHLKLTQAESDRLLGAALEAGVRVIDTAACYGSEEAIGRAIGHRRDEYALVSKCGHAIEPGDPPEWSAELVRVSAERSLRLLKTDRLDVLLLHTCELSHLDDDAMIEALVKCKRDGLTRLIGFSGENAAADKAIAMGVFDCLETSVNIADQQALDGWLPAAAKAGLGVLAKRAMANTAWRDLTDYGSIYPEYARPYAERLLAMRLTPEAVGFDGDWMELAIRFAAWQPGVSTVLAGSRSPEHLPRNVAMVGKGPLPDPVVAKLRTLWKAHDHGAWIGLT